MAPELWRAEQPSPATDVYATTCVFYECLTGEPPYGRDAAALPRRQRSAPVPTEPLPPALRPPVERGLAEHPADRPQSAAAFLTELQDVATRLYGTAWEERGRGRPAAAAVRWRGCPRWRGS